MFRTAFLVLILCQLCATSSAQTPPLWGGLEQGPYAVGYRATFRFDRSRVFTPERDFRGRSNVGERGRPVQIRVWYPAEAAAGAARMPYGDYLSISADGVPAVVIEGLRERTLGLHRYSARKYFPESPEGLFERLVLMPTAVVKDAPLAAAGGPFPVVVYAGGANHSTEENTVLWEYLASHGYIVAAVPSMAPRSADFTADAQGLETLARDLEFLIGDMHEFAGADLSRLGAMGFSYGGAAALLVAMRNPDVDAVVGFDASFIAKRFGGIIRNSPSFNLESLTVPLLEFHRRDPATVSYDLTNTLRYSRRYSFDIEGLDHVDFNSYSLLYGAARGTEAGTNAKLGAKQTAYREMARYTLKFLDAYVKRRGEDAPLKRPDDWKGYGPESLTFRFSEALPAPPSASDLLTVIREEGIERGEQLYTELRRRDANAAVLLEPRIDEIGNSLLGGGKTDEALRVFKWNAEAYPRSASAYYGLAQAYEKKGDLACVAYAYRKALEVLPADTTTSESDKAVVRRDADAALKKSATATPAGKCELEAR
jgi:dienelactone hydrolase